MGVDPVALDQLLEPRAIKTAGTTIIDILDTRLLAQFGDAQPRREALVLPPGRLAIEQKPEPFVMAEPAARRAGVRAAFAVVSGLFVLFAVAGLFAALFFLFEPERGPAAAALICAAIALVLAILASLPLMFRRRTPPPPRYEGSLLQFVSLMAKTAPNLAPRQIILTAALIGVALALSGRGSKK